MLLNAATVAIFFAGTTGMCVCTHSRFLVIQFTSRRNSADSAVICRHVPERHDSYTNFGEYTVVQFTSFEYWVSHQRALGDDLEASCLVRRLNLIRFSPILTLIAARAQRVPFRGTLSSGYGKAICSYSWHPLSLSSLVLSYSFGIRRYVLSLNHY